MLGRGGRDSRILGEGRVWERESPSGPEQTSQPPHASLLRPSLLVNSDSAALGGEGCPGRGGGGLARYCKFPEDKVREGWGLDWSLGSRSLLFPIPPSPIQFLSPGAVGFSLPSPSYTPSLSHKFSLWGLLLQSLLQYRVPGWALGTHRGRSPTVCGSHEDPG